MKRRTFLHCGLTALGGANLFAMLQNDHWEEAARILERSTAAGDVSAAVLHVSQRGSTFSRRFGNAPSHDSMFLLGSISKPIAVAALMTLFDQGAFDLENPLQKFLPTFAGDGREKVTIRHLLTHVSGLPDQLPNNNLLRKSHASLAEFAEHAIRTPLHFEPGTRYQYSSMAILLASQVAERISGTEIRKLIETSVFQPLQMEHSAQGLGHFSLEEMITCQTEHAAPESGGGDPDASDWDWNSSYWRALGAPWGGTHASAADVARFLAEFLYARGKILKPDTARRMASNQNGPGITPRGLGLNVGSDSGSPGCSERTFGHTGSTGTLCWADHASETLCVILTSLPARAIDPHPRDVASAAIAALTN